MAKIVRRVLLFVFIVMFSWQMFSSMDKLIKKPKVDSTEWLDITEIELPLITICSSDQYNLTKMKEYGYEESLFFTGFNIYKGASLSWGAQANLTYPELLNRILQDLLHTNTPQLTIEQNTKKLKYDTILLAKFGHCYEIESYDPIQPILIPLYSLQKSVLVFVTDARLQTYYSRAFISQIGGRIHVEPKQFYSYQLDVEINSGDHAILSLDDECVTKSPKTFENCVQDYIEQDVMPKLTCVPPWLSNSTQPCTGILTNRTFFNYAFQEFKYSYVEPLRMYSSNIAEEMCAKPCLQTQIQMRMIGQDSQARHSQVQLKFNQEVKFTRKVEYYSFLQFLVDVGSSLGLWLGLSIIGLIDLGVQLAAKTRVLWKSIFRS